MPDENPCRVMFGFFLDIGVVSNFIRFVDDRLVSSAVSFSYMSSFMSNDECDSTGFILFVTEKYDWSIINDTRHTLESRFGQYINRYDWNSALPEIIH